MPTPAPAPDALAPSPLDQLIERAQEGDLSALPDLRRWLDQEPALWQQCGDLAKHAELVWLRLVAGKNLVLQESMPRKLAEMKSELGGAEPTALERLLVERIVICWLQVHHADVEAASGQCGPAAHPATREQLRKRLESAHKRYLHAIKQLALVRKLLQRAPSPLEVAERLPLREKPPRKPETGNRMQFAEAMN